jgi:hypothetical protein
MLLKIDQGVVHFLFKVVIQDFALSLQAWYNTFGRWNSIIILVFFFSEDGERKVLY